MFFVTAVDSGHISQNCRKEVANLLKKSIYFNKLVGSYPSKSKTLKVARKTEAMLANEELPSNVGSWVAIEKLKQKRISLDETFNSSHAMLKGTKKCACIEVRWDPTLDNIVY